MNKKELIIPLAAVVLIILIGIVIVWRSGQPADKAPEIPVATTTPVATSTTSTVSTTIISTSQTYYPYGSVTLSLNESAGFKDGLSIRPLAVLEDSRCPIGVMCIQAGTVRITLRVNSGGGATSKELKLGDTIATGGESITFVSIEPVRRQDSSIGNSQYRFTFSVEPGTGGIGAKPCYVGGCSSQLCSEEPGMVSTCEYRDSYACYRGATCERQSSGKCGWTETSELKACLANPPALQ